MSTVESTPQASLLLHSLRSVGYSEETAIADIIDNSVSADADEIRIFFDWEKQMVSIVDNGEGMGQAELYKNMQIGSADPSETRSAKDLGRFGMGMKTAAFSLGRKVTVVSVSAGQYCNASWDLDCVNNLGWRLIIDDSGNVNNYLSRYKEHGTAVIISKLDTLIDVGDANKSKKHFYRVIDNVEVTSSILVSSLRAKAPGNKPNRLVSGRFFTLVRKEKTTRKGPENRLCTYFVSPKRKKTCNDAA